jgi:hypothetical protein
LLSGFSTVQKHSEPEWPIQLEVWPTEWHFGLKGTGKFKMNLTLTHTLLPWLEQLDSFSAKFGNGTKAPRLTETLPSDTEEDFKASIF